MANNKFTSVLLSLTFLFRLIYSSFQILSKQIKSKLDTTFSRNFRTQINFIDLREARQFKFGQLKFR